MNLRKNVAMFGLVGIVYGCATDKLMSGSELPNLVVTQASAKEVRLTHSSIAYESVRTDFVVEVCNKGITAYSYNLEVSASKQVYLGEGRGTVSYTDTVSLKYPLLESECQVVKLSVEVSDKWDKYDKDYYVCVDTRDLLSESNEEDNCVKLNGVKRNN